MDSNQYPRRVLLAVTGLSPQVVLTAFDATVGKTVSKGAKLATLEAMKMQTNILAPADGTVTEPIAYIVDVLTTSTGCSVIGLGFA